MKDIDKYIYELHKNLGHLNPKDIQNELIRRNIFFKGITKIINNVCNSCNICNLKKIQGYKKAKI